MNKRENLKNKNVGVALLGDPNNKKTNKGITLVALIVTIIIILIISGVGIYVGMDTVEHSRLVKFVSYMQIIQKKVDEVVSGNDYSKLGTQVIGHEKQSDIQNILSEANANGEINTVDASEYRYFNKQALLNQLELDITEDEMEVVINFRTREVVNLKGIEYNSKTYYTQYLLPTGQNLISKVNEGQRALNFNINKKNDGLQATVTITNISITNGTLSYKEDGKEWKIINNYTNENTNEEIIISKSGKYIFRLVDNNNQSNTYHKDVKVVLVNPPILEGGLAYIKEEYDYSEGINSTAGAVATDGTKEYVWVPRFAYKENDDKTITRSFIKGVSNLTTYNEKIEENWTVPKQFSNESEVGFLEKTGIWMLESEIDELTDIPTYVTITYVTENPNEVSNMPDNIIVKQGTEVKISELIPKRNGYEFLYWMCVSGGNIENKNPGESIIANENITVYAEWEPTIVKEYVTISYGTENPTEVSNMPEDIIVEKGSVINISEITPMRHQYTFKGWSFTAANNSVDINPGDTIVADSDITLYAVWRSDSNIIAFNYATHGSYTSTINSIKVGFLYEEPPNLLEDAFASCPVIVEGFGTPCTDPGINETVRYSQETILDLSEFKYAIVFIHSSEPYTYGYTVDNLTIGENMWGSKIKSEDNNSADSYKYTLFQLWGW